MKRRGFLAGLAASLTASLAIAQSGQDKGTGEGLAATKKARRIAADRWWAENVTPAPEPELSSWASGATYGGRGYLYLPSASWWPEPTLKAPRKRDARGRFV